MNLQKLRPIEPISQVVFIHDYFQLVFQDETFSIYNHVELKIGDRHVHGGQAGFCDELVSLIGQRATEVTRPEGFALSVHFESGVQLLVSDYGLGPEAFQFNNVAGHLFVEQNVQYGAPPEGSATLSRR